MYLNNIERMRQIASAMALSGWVLVLSLVLVACSGTPEKPYREPGSFVEIESTNPERVEIRVLTEKSTRAGNRSTASVWFLPATQEIPELLLDAVGSSKAIKASIRSDLFKPFTFQVLGRVEGDYEDCDEMVVVSCVKVGRLAYLELAIKRHAIPLTDLPPVDLIFCLTLPFDCSRVNQMVGIVRDFDKPGAVYTGTIGFYSP